MILSNNSGPLRLLHCPFCIEDSEVVLVPHRNLALPFSERTFHIECNECGICSPRFSSAAKAIGYWNTRWTPVKPPLALSFWQKLFAPTPIDHQIEIVKK